MLSRRPPVENRARQLRSHLDTPDPGGNESEPECYHVVSQELSQVRLEEQSDGRGLPVAAIVATILAKEIGIVAGARAFDPLPL